MISQANDLESLTEGDLIYEGQIVANKRKGYGKL